MLSIHSLLVVNIAFRGSLFIGQTAFSILFSVPLGALCGKILFVVRDSLVVDG